MEREISSDIITRLTIVKNKPSFVKYLTNNRVIITDEFGTHIVNPITDTIIQKIDYSSSRPILCQNKERIGLAHPLSCYIRVYDIENDDVKEIDCSKFPYSSIDHIHHQKIRQITFHPHNSQVLVLLSQKNNQWNESCTFIHYWNIKKEQPIYAIRLLDSSGNGATDLSISPDGTTRVLVNDPNDSTKLIVALWNECIMLPVPSEINKKVNEEKFLLIHWILKNYQCNSVLLPRDVVHYIDSTLYQTYNT